MKKSTIHNLTFSALFAALVLVATMFFHVPLAGNGYANLGDCFVIVGALILGYYYGALAAAIGSALADLFLGFAIYSPATFIIKGLMAVVACLVFRAFNKKGDKLKYIGLILSAVCAEIVMVVGYFVFELFLYGTTVATVDILGNATQAVVGLISAIVVYTVLDKSKVLNKVFAK